MGEEKCVQSSLKTWLETWGALMYEKVLQLALKMSGSRLACLHLCNVVGCCEYGNELSDPINTVNLLISALIFSFSKDHGATLISRLYCCYSSTFRLLLFCHRPTSMFIDEYGSAHWGFLVYWQWRCNRRLFFSPSVIGITFTVFPIILKKYASSGVSWVWQEQ
jgi:hypothetical protein